MDDKRYCDMRALRHVANETEVCHDLFRSANESRDQRMLDRFIDGRFGWGHVRPAALRSRDGQLIGPADRPTVHKDGVSEC